MDLALFGVTGRMGGAVLRALREGGDWRLSGALASPQSARLGLDAAAAGAPTGVAVTADPRAALAGATVAIDFSVAGSVAAHALACATASVPLVVCATGLDASARDAVRTASASIAVLLAPNTSVGVVLATELVRAAARALGTDYDVEIVEAHHRGKRDAPSGTALALGEAAAGARGQVLAQVAVYERAGQAAARRAGDIGFAVIRAGDIVGEHTVTFAAAGEQIQIVHRATDRMIFARGALRAAGWLVGRAAGLYEMSDVVAAS